MKVLMTTWEFPPNKIGGIASHCEDLSKALARRGHELHVLTYGDKRDTTRPFEEYEITVHHVPVGYAPDTISWSMALGRAMEKKAIELQKEEKFELVHAHDWMTVPAAVGIKKTTKLPIVFTLHSTEDGRSGIHDKYTKMINDLEWYGTYEATEIITVGKDFSDEVKRLFSPPDEKLHYIPNGVDITRFENPKFFVDRKNYLGDWEKLVLFVGRLSHQKGVNFLIDAMPKVLEQHPDSKFIFTGSGALDYYRGLVNGKGLAHKAYFTGFLDEKLLPSMYQAADLVVAPSIYEPFGIVALEANAARTPVVGSYTGGLKETIVHEWSGLHHYNANPKSIADQINRSLDDESWRHWMGDNGRKRVEKDFTWTKIANWTSGVYGKAIGLW